MRFILKYTAVCVGIAIVIALVVILFGGVDSQSTHLQKASRESRFENGFRYRSDFTYTGDQSEIIEVTNGTVNFNLSYPGESRFSAILSNPDGTVNKVITNSVGPYEKYISFDVEQYGLYTLDVKTSGKWSLSQN